MPGGPPSVSDIGDFSVSGLGTGIVAAFCLPLDGCNVEIDRSATSAPVLGNKVLGRYDVSRTSEGVTAMRQR